MATRPGTQTYRSRRAVPRDVVRHRRLVALLHLALLGAFLAAQLGAVRGYGVVTLHEGFPPPLATVAVALLAAWQVGLALMTERMARRDPPTWTLTDEGLVRAQGDDVRTIPLSRFRHVHLRPTSEGHGDLRLTRRNLVSLARTDWMRTREGLVHAPGNALYIPDVERAEELEAALWRRLS